jgi:hypothetical protein
VHEVATGTGYRVQGTGYRAVHSIWSATVVRHVPNDLVHTMHRQWMQCTAGNAPAMDAMHRQWMQCTESNAPHAMHWQCMFVFYMCLLQCLCLIVVPITGLATEIDKRSSLLRYGINYGLQKFYNTGQWSRNQAFYSLQNSVWSQTQTLLKFYFY